MCGRVWLSTLNNRKCSQCASINVCSKRYMTSSDVSLVPVSFHSLIALPPFRRNNTQATIETVTSLGPQQNCIRNARIACTKRARNIIRIGNECSIKAPAAQTRFLFRECISHCLVIVRGDVSVVATLHGISHAPRVCCARDNKAFQLSFCHDSA